MPTFSIFSRNNTREQIKIPDIGLIVWYVVDVVSDLALFNVYLIAKILLNYNSTDKISASVSSWLRGYILKVQDKH